MAYTDNIGEKLGGRTKKMKLSFSFLRTVVRWGTLGKDGKQPVKYVAIANMSDDHLHAVINTQPAHKEILFLMQRELAFRQKHKMKVEETIVDY